MDRAEFEDWLKRQTQEQCTLIATRAALRALPYACEAHSHWNSKALALMSLRAILTSGVACTMPTPEIRDRAANAANNAVHAANNAIDSTNASYSANAADAAVSAARAAEAVYTTNAAYAAVACAAVACAADAAAGNGPRDTTYAAAFKDTECELNNLMFQPVWLTPREPLFLEIWRDETDQHLDEAEFSFWSEWYQGFILGKLLDWELQRRVALIEDGIWEAGPEAVAKEIERIRALNAVEKALADLSIKPETFIQSRHSVGGNNPPEAIEDLESLQQSVALIWAGIEAVED